MRKAEIVMFHGHTTCMATLKSQSLNAAKRSAV